LQLRQPILQQISINLNPVFWVYLLKVTYHLFKALSQKISDVRTQLPLALFWLPFGLPPGLPDMPFSNAMCLLVFTVVYNLHMGTYQGLLGNNLFLIRSAIPLRREYQVAYVFLWPWKIIELRVVPVLV
jgi:hypothetical protein